MRLGRYETLVRLGRGGMAEVFAARLSGEAGFAKLVAVKRMLAHLAADEALVARFHDEARLAAYITSPYVVQTLDVGRSEDGQPFIVLELVLGVSLAHLLEQRPLPSLPVRLELVTQAALGLADVHEACAPDGTPLDIVHRD
ncbi:MAG TPA: protein kinase, partial [Sandaracinaceae bacterium]